MARINQASLYTSNKIFYWTVSVRPLASRICRYYLRRSTVENTLQSGKGSTFDKVTSSLSSIPVIIKMHFEAVCTVKIIQTFLSLCCQLSQVPKKNSELINLAFSYPFLIPLLLFKVRVIALDIHCVAFPSRKVLHLDVDISHLNAVKVIYILWWLNLGSVKNGILFGDR